MRWRFKGWYCSMSYKRRNCQQVKLPLREVYWAVVQGAKEPIIFYSLNMSGFGCLHVYCCWSNYSSSNIDFAKIFYLKIFFLSRILENLTNIAHFNEIIESLGLRTLSGNYCITFFFSILTKLSNSSDSRSRNICVRLYNIL